LLDSQGQHERALHYARRGVSLYPAHEGWNLSLMRLLRALGQHEAEARHYQDFKKALQREVWSRRARAAYRAGRQAQPRAARGETAAEVEPSLMFKSLITPASPAPQAAPVNHTSSTHSAHVAISAAPLPSGTVVF
jgi:hypothetical protein